MEMNEFLMQREEQIKKSLEDAKDLNMKLFYLQITDTLVFKSTVMTDSEKVAFLRQTNKEFEKIVNGLF